MLPFMPTYRPEVLQQGQNIEQDGFLGRIKWTEITSWMTLANLC